MLILLVALLAVSGTALAAERPTYVAVGAGLTDDSLVVDGRADLYTNKRRIIPYGTLLTYPRPFIDKPILRLLRWSLELGASPYKVNYQVIDRVTDVPEHNRHNKGNEADLGTSVSGFMAHVTPTISLYAELTSWLHGYLGFGVGAGYADVKGSYYVTEGTSASAACLSSTTVATVQSNCERVELDTNALGLTSSATLGFKIGYVGVRWLRAGPAFKSAGVTHTARSDLATIFLQIPL